MRTQSPLSRSETRFLHTLYQSYAGPLYRVAHHRLGDPYLAQDLVQTVFLAAAEKLPTLRRHENPWAWLLRALHYELSHTYTKLARERQRQKALPRPSLRRDCPSLRHRPGGDAVPLSRHHTDGHRADPRGLPCPLLHGHPRTRARHHPHPGRPAGRGHPQRPALLPPW